MTTLHYRQPRDARLVGGCIAALFGAAVLFFTTLVALQSFAEHPVAVIVAAVFGLLLLVGGLYFAACTPAMELDPERGTITLMRSCWLVSPRRVEKLARVSEVGVREAYYAGSHVEESGAKYSAEIRGPETIVVPGTTGTDARHATSVAREIAEAARLRFNPRFRKVFTGSFKLR